MASSPTTCEVHLRPACEPPPSLLPSSEGRLLSAQRDPLLCHRHLPRLSEVSATAKEIKKKSDRFDGLGISSLIFFLTSQVMLNSFDAQSLDAQPFAPHVGHSPPLIPSPWQVSQEGDIFLF